MRGTHPGFFAMVMATSIVSAALGQVGHARLSGMLLAIAIAAFAVLAVASGWRAVVYPAYLRVDLSRPDRAFTSFAVVAACDVLGDDLASDGHFAVAAALAAVALLAWICLTVLVPGRLAVRHRPPITDVNGSWYLWVVGTQSLAIAAVFIRTGGLIPARPTAVAAIAAWSAGLVLYLVMTVLVAARLLIAGLAPQEGTAPYWVTMSAAATTALAAVEIMGMPGAPAGGARTALTGVAVTFWVLATCLIPVLSARSLWRHLRLRLPLRYRADLWKIVFPMGVYATASLKLGTVAGLAPVHRAGMLAVWPAAVAWALTFTAMMATLLTRARTRA